VKREEPHGPGPIFVGGTGRCGTHVVAALVGSSGRYAQVPAELRVHAVPQGLPGFARGVRSRRRLLGWLRGQWRHRPAWDPGRERGIHRIAPRARYLRALAGLAAAPPGADRIAISRALVNRLLNSLAPAPRAWVEKSPDNCASAGFLRCLFPNLRVIHVIRDGRDVACSYMRVPWAPDDFAGALGLWERRLLEAHRGTLEVPSDQVLALRFEDLVSRDRDAAYRALLEFMGIPDDAALRSFFDAELTAERAGIGRWRADLPTDMHPLANSLYRDSLERLADAGVAPLPDRNPVPEPVRTRSPSPIDPWSAPAPSF
jgi:hypothetical protein